MTSRVVGDVAVRVGADVGPLKIGLQDGGRQMDRFGRRGRTMGQTIRRGATIAATAITALAGSIAAAAARSISAMDGIGKKADQIGIAVEAFQELRFAAESAGVSNTAFTSSMERFSKRLGEAAQGTGAAARVLEQLGLNAQALADLGIERSFEVIADEIAGMEQATERAAVAAALFGREGVAMVNMLRDGSAALRQTRQEAREMGAVIGEDTVRDAEALQDELGRLKDVISAQLSEALIEVGPLLVGMAEFIANIATQANNAVSAVSDFASGIIESMTDAREQLRLTQESAGGTGPNSTRADRGAGDGGGVNLGGLAEDMIAGTDITGEVDRRGRPLSPAEMEERARAQAQEQARIALDAQREAFQTYQSGLADVFSGGRNDFVGLPNQEPTQLDDILLDPEDEDGGGGGSGGGARNILDAITPSDEDIEAMREQFISAEDMVRERYEEQLRMVDAFYADQEGKAEEHAAMRLEIERRMQQELAQIRMAAAGEALGATSQMFEALAQAAGQGGEKLLRVSKILSAAQAFVNTLAGASEALRLPFPANLAAAAKVISTGLGFVAAIRGTSSSGGGQVSPGVAGSSVSGGQTVGAPDEGPQRPSVALTLIGDQGFSRAQIVQIAEALNDSTDDGQLVEIRGRR
jgi:hypothetical protein